MYDPGTNLDPESRDHYVSLDPEFLELPEAWRQEDFADLLPDPPGYEEPPQ